jgi:hypothetical protein
MNDDRMEEQSDDLGDPGAELVESMADGDATYVTESSRKVNQGTMVLFGILLLGAAGLYFMYLKTGPAKATAATEAAAEADTTIASFLTDGDRNIADMQRMLMETEKVVEEFQNHSNKPQVPLAQLPTNPFKYIPLKPETTARDEEELKKKREEERQAAVKAVQALQLQSILFGDIRRACMINNRMYAEGERVNDFTIEKINQDSVIVRTGAFRFALQMQR